MADLQVDIVTPRRAVFSGSATEIRVPGQLGEFGVLPGHAHLLALIRAGICVVHTAQGERRFVVGRGFVDVGPDHVTVLADSAEPVEDVDRAKAERELHEAEAVLAKMDTMSAEYTLAEEKAALSRARLGI